MYVGGIMTENSVLTQMGIISLHSKSRPYLVICFARIRFLSWSYRPVLIAEISGNMYVHVSGTYLNLSALQLRKISKLSEFLYWRAKPNSWREVQNTRQLMLRTVLLNTCESTICHFQHANQQPQEVDIKEAESISQDSQNDVNLCLAVEHNLVRR